MYIRIYIVSYLFNFLVSLKDTEDVYTCLYNSRCLQSRVNFVISDQRKGPQQLEFNDFLGTNARKRLRGQKKNACYCPHCLNSFSLPPLHLRIGALIIN